MQLLPSLTRNSSRVLLVAILASRMASAMPQDLYYDIPSRTVSAPLAKRTGGHSGELRLPKAVTVSIVLSIVAIVLISICICCPCWTWPWNKAAGVRQRQRPGGPAELDGRYNARGPNEMDAHQTPLRSELHENDAPPRYEEIGSDVRVDGVPAVDPKGTTQRGRAELTGSEVGHEMGSGWRSSGTISGESSMRWLPPAHVR